MYKKGFTLIEILVAVSIFMILATSTFSFGIHDLWHATFADTRTQLLDALHKARSQTMNAVCGTINCTAGTSHGVHFNTDSYTLFSGNTYNPTDIYNETVSLDPNTHLTGMNEVIFTAPSGDATTTPYDVWTITISDNAGHTATTTISDTGQIYQ